MLRTAVSALLLGCMLPAWPQTVIKMSTLAPEGSPWHTGLQSMAERWRKISGGQVKLVIYPGGVLGDEPDMVNKMRIGQIQAAGLSGAGLSGIEPGVMALQIPMMFDSYDELDYVRDRIAPRLEKLIEARGYLVLNWGDVGWVQFFTTVPASRLADLRRLKLFTWAGGDNETLELWKANGFRPVPLAATDILTSLQTGLIEAVPTTPLYALLNQSFGIARNMIDVHWAPLIGATVITRRAWDSLPAAMRPDLLAAGREAGGALRGGIRKMGDEAIATMQKRRLQVTALTVDDVRLGSDPPQLYIRKAKFYKSRIVPIHPSTADQLRAYLQERNRVKLRRPSKAFFITGRRLPLSYAALGRMFRQLVEYVGIKNAGGKRGPLLHSFRHGFAVQRLLTWYADNLDVRALIPHLSVYLGHLSKEETYWYLTATPELLTAAGEAFRRTCEPGGDS